MAPSMRPHGSPQTLERRRRRAISLLRKGHTFRDVADRLDASLSSVVRWCQCYRRLGQRGLSSRPTLGRPCRLNEGQLVRLGDVLSEGAQAAGYPNELWTLKRIAAIVAREFGVRYCASGVWRLLCAELRWSSQKPERRATQRDEEAIAHWKRHVWPHIKKRLGTTRALGIS